jgi:hypothetical protein
MDEASQQARETVSGFIENRPAAPEELVSSVLEEIQVFDYAWQPALPEIGPLTEREEVLARFLFGGLLFGAYAQAAKSFHLLQPKRSRLYLAMALNAGTAAYDHEKELFQELKKIAQQSASAEASFFEMENLPPFLYYLLLRDPEKPLDLLRAALNLKKSGEVKDYRNWRAELLRNWREKGRIAPKTTQKIFETAQKTRQAFEVQGEFEINLGVSIPMVGIPSLEVGKDNVPIGRLWGWVVQLVPGQRHSKMLMRLSMAEREYRYAETHLKAIWAAG